MYTKFIQLLKVNFYWGNVLFSIYCFIDIKEYIEERKYTKPIIRNSIAYSGFKKIKLYLFKIFLLLKISVKHCTLLFINENVVSNIWSLSWFKWTSLLKFHLLVFFNFISFTINIVLTISIFTTHWYILVVVWPSLRP